MKRLIVLGAMLAGCDDPLAEAQRIESTRVLGARVEAAGDPLRAWPEPGESATVRWLVADPRPAPPLGWAFSLCVGAPTVRGVPECDAPPFAELASPGPSAALPSFDFSMPDQATLGSADRVLIRGAICADAQPVLAEPLDRSRCEGELELVLIEVGIASVEGANLNPSLGDAPISFDGAVWPEPPATLLGASDCSSADAAPELPLVSADAAVHRVELALAADDREASETLFVSHAATAGRFDRQLTVIEPESADLSASIDWKAPGSGADTNRIARLYFVVRDLRGGVDWTARTLCVVP